MKKELEKLNYDQLNKLSKDVQKELFKKLEQIILQEHLNNTHFDSEGSYICHICQGTNTCKSGVNDQGKQRYKCKDCSKVMIAQQNIITFSSKKNFSQWILFLTSMLDGDSLATSAEKANISERSAFRWRHKFLYLLQNLLNQEVLFDVVHLDETLFPVVYKNPKRPNEKMKQRGMSNQKINVTCAIDNYGHTILQVADTGRIKSKSLIQIYDQKIQEKSIVVSDSLRSYHQLMKHLKIQWKKIPSKKKSFEEYTLEPINSLHALIKDFFYKYKGISVKYLQGYLALFDYQNKRRKYYQERIFMSIIMELFTSFSNLKCADIDSGMTLYS